MPNLTDVPCEWATNSVNNHIIVSNDKVLTRHHSHGWKTIASGSEFKEGKVTVTFHCVSTGELVVGVVPTGSNVVNTATFIGQGDGWGYHVGNGNLYHAGGTKGGNRVVTNGQVVKMELDFKLRTISFNVNDAILPYGTAFENLCGPVCIAVSMCSIGQNVAVTISSQRPVGIVVKEPIGYRDSTLHETLLRQISLVRHKLNLVVLGEMGAGKSSLINTMITALHNDTEIYQEALSFGESNAHVTKRLSSYSLPDLNVKLWDAWGWTNSNYQNQLTYLLDGQLEAGFLMDNSARRGEPNFKVHPDVGDMMHAVIFVIDATNTLDNQAFGKRLAHFRQIAQERDYRPVLVITKVDVLDTRLSSDLSELFTGDSVQKCVSSVADVTGFSPNQIFPCKLYRGEYDRSLLVETPVLMALWAAIKAALRFVEKANAPGGAAGGEA